MNNMFPQKALYCTKPSVHNKQMTTTGDTHSSTLHHSSILLALNDTVWQDQLMSEICFEQIFIQYMEDLCIDL